jgi:hypothetical protein
MAAQDTQRHLPLLTDDNYHSWKFTMKMQLIGKGLWEITEGTEVAEEDARQQDIRYFKKRENMALATICLGVAERLQIYVRNSKCAKEAWDALEDHFEEKTLSRKIMVRRKLYQARMKGSMVEHINYVRTIADQLESLDDPVSEKDLVMVLLSSLPDHYNTLLTTLETLDEKRLTWQYVRDRLLTEFERRKSEYRTPLQPRQFQDALLCDVKNGGVKEKFGDNRRSNGDYHHQGTDNSSGYRTSRRCYYCNEIGHLQRDCLRRKLDLELSENHQQQSAAFCRVSREEDLSGFCPELAL